MRRLLLLLTVMSVFIVLAMVGFTIDVAAVGAPTENYTIPNIPTSDPANDEIKPPVNCILQGPSSLSNAPPPAFMADFTGASALEDRKSVV